MVLIYFVIGMITKSVKYSNSLLIDAPIEKSWSIFMDQDRFSEWMSGFERFEILEGQKGEVGAKYRLHFKEGEKDIRIDETVTHIDPPNHYGFDIDTEVFDGHIDVKFEEDGSKTRMTAGSEFRGKSAFLRSMFAMMKSSFKKNELSNYVRLKDIIENSDWKPEPEIQQDSIKIQAMEAIDSETE